MDTESDRDKRPEVLDAALVEVEKSMARENSLTRDVMVMEENPANNMLENLEKMVWKVRTMADNLENMLRIIKIMRVVTEMNKKGKCSSMDTIINLASNMNMGSKAQKTSEEVTEEKVYEETNSTEDNTEDNTIDTEKLLNKMLEENPDMSNNPMAKLLLQMLEQKKS